MSCCLQKCIDDGANRIEFSRKFEEPITEVKAEFEGINQDELDERGKFPDFIYFIKGSDTLYTGKTYELNRVLYLLFLAL